MKGITWFLIADVSRARLFEAHHRTGKALELIFEDDQPELRDREQRRASDRPGRVHERYEPARHAAEPHTTNDEKARERWGRELVDRLREEASRRQFHNLVLVAPPALLGTLRKLLDSQFGGRLVGDLAKDLAGVSQHELPEHLEAWLGP